MKFCSLILIPKVLGLLGLGLLVLNLIGLALPLRSPDIGPSYADFARPTTTPYEDALDVLEALDDSDTHRFVTEATRVFHYGMAHIEPADIRHNGLDFYRMRVPVWENYFLYALSYLKPDTYRDYEFCNYQKALERGTGRCGQQSMALVGYLSERSIETGFISLGGHALATAKVGEEWYLLDADFGGVIPFDLSVAEQDPIRVLDYYWGDAASVRNLYQLFSPEHNAVRYGGPEARYARACPIEKVVYVLKWIFPVLLITPWVMAVVRRRAW